MDSWLRVAREMDLSMENSEFWIGIGIAVAVLAVFYFLWTRRLVVAKPNEWLLVIKNGKMKNAGIGIQAMKGWKTQVVTFPSMIHKVQFQAQQVTREMQGIQVSGFVVWVVYRDDDGPFRAYKYLEGLGDSGDSPQASENISRMAESIIRHQIANSSIDEVISQRENLRDKIRTEMQEVVKGWGVWLETVEITDVTILSQTLFEDLQAKFRQEARKDAETIRLQTEREIEEKTIQQNLELSIKRSEAELRRRTIEEQQNLKISLQKAEAEAKHRMFEEQQRLECEKLDAKLAAERIRLETEILEAQQSLKKLRQTYSFVLDSTELDQKLELMQREWAKIETSDWGKRAETMASVERICQSLPLNELRLVQMNGGGGGSGGGSGGSVDTGVLPQLIEQVQWYQDSVANISRDIKEQSRGIREEGQNLRQVGKTLQDESRSILEESRGIRQEGQNIRETGKGIRDESRGIREEGQSIREASQGIKDAGNEIAQASDGTREANREIKEARQGIQREQDEVRSQEKAVKQRETPSPEPPPLPPAQPSRSANPSSSAQPASPAPSGNLFLDNASVRRPSPVPAAPESGAKPAGGELPPRDQWKMVSMNATVHGVNAKNRELLLKGEREKVLTVEASNEVNLDSIEVGDTVVVDYWLHKKVEFREPTPDEKKHNFSVIAQGGKDPAGFPPGTVLGPVMKELVSVRAIDKVNQVVTVMGPEGKFMGIPVDDPAILEGVEVGRNGILTYSEPVAMSVVVV